MYADGKTLMYDNRCQYCINNVKPFNTQEIQEWEKEFDSQNWCCDSIVLDAIKSFISQKLKEQRREIVSELEKCKEDENIWDYIYALKKQI